MGNHNHQSKLDIIKQEKQVRNVEGYFFFCLSLLTNHFVGFLFTWHLFMCALFFLLCVCVFSVFSLFGYGHINKR